jgi:hypothetical protein
MSYIRVGRLFGRCCEARTGVSGKVSRRSFHGHDENLMTSCHWRGVGQVRGQRERWRIGKQRVKGARAINEQEGVG